MHKEQCGLDLVLARSLGTGLRAPAGPGCALSVPHQPPFPGLVPPSAAGSPAAGLRSLSCGWCGSDEWGSACHRPSRPGWRHGRGPSGPECGSQRTAGCRGKRGPRLPVLSPVLLSLGKAPTPQSPSINSSNKITSTGSLGGLKAACGCLPSGRPSQDLLAPPTWLFPWTPHQSPHVQDGPSSFLQGSVVQVP